MGTFGESNAKEHEPLNGHHGYIGVHRLSEVAEKTQKIQVIRLYPIVPDIFCTFDIPDH